LWKELFFWKLTTVETCECVNSWTATYDKTQTSPKLELQFCLSYFGPVVYTLVQISKQLHCGEVVRQCFVKTKIYKFVKFSDCDNNLLKKLGLQLQKIVTSAASYGSHL